MADPFPLRPVTADEYACFRRVHAHAFNGGPLSPARFARALRQFAQMVVAATASAAILSDVQWGPVLRAAAVSAVTTLILAAVDALPGVPDISSLPPAPSAPLVASAVSTSPGTSSTGAGVTFTLSSLPVAADDDPPKHAA